MEFGKRQMHMSDTGLLVSPLHHRTMIGIVTTDGWEFIRTMIPAMKDMPMRVFARRLAEESCARTT